MSASHAATSSIAHSEPFSESVGNFTLSGRRQLPAAQRRLKNAPLVIAIHGGTYTSAYFDLPGYSLLERAGALGIPIIALDRPCYGNSTPLEPGKETIARQAERLAPIIGELFARHGDRTTGVVLIGHSIGGATAIEIAARHPAWPLSGIAVSGVCLHTPPESKGAWESLPPGPITQMPQGIKDVVMFGPAHSFAPEMPALSHQAHSPVPLAELLDIVTGFPARVRSLLGEVTVPVHHRMGEFDKLWITNANEVRHFGQACLRTPHVDAQLFAGAGHCIDFHLLGASFQLEQLAFALRCGAQSAMHD